MTQSWILFRSITHAQNAARWLERAGFTATVSRAPQGLNPKGCGYAVQIRKSLEEAVRILSEHKIPYGKLYRRNDASEFYEVTA